MNVEKWIEVNKDKPLPWSEYRKYSGLTEANKRCITDAQIEIELGLCGDKFTAVPIGHIGNVRSLYVGEEGSGKTNLLNFILSSLDESYSCDTLKIHTINLCDKDMIDNELIVKSNSPLYNKEIADCFGELRKLCQSRYEFLIQNQYRSVRDYNMKKREFGKEQECVPRVLGIVDEFQLIRQVDEKHYDMIMHDLNYILKVGRTVGIHLGIFMRPDNKVLPNDYLAQFSLRCIMPSDISVYNTFLRREHGIVSKPDIGYMHVQTIDCDTKPRLCRIPDMTK